MATMNQYGRRAMRHWEEFLPERLAELEEPEEFFLELGEQAAEDIDALADDLVARYPNHDQAPDAEREAQLATARRLAESQVARDLLLVDPEDEEKIAQLMG
jgi:hypothetical protein